MAGPTREEIGDGIVQWAMSFNAKRCHENPGVERPHFKTSGRRQLANIGCVYGGKLAALLDARQWREFYATMADLAVAIEINVFDEHAEESAADTVTALIHDFGFRFCGESAAEVAELAQRHVADRDPTALAALLRELFLPPPRPQ